MQNILAYNSAFAFALMTLTGHEFVFQGKGPYCLWINGQVYHTISQLLPEPGVAPNFSQLYLHDAAAKLNGWLNIFSNLHKEIVCDLQEMINYVDPYMSLYHSVWDFLNANPAQDVSLVMRTSSEDIDSQQYNVPAGTDIATIIPVENDDQPINKNIVIYQNRESHP